MFFVCLFAACNRTYYGDVDQTYDLEIRRPREDRLPFVCHLNFTAAGGEFGDLVQVSCSHSHSRFTLVLAAAGGGTWCRVWSPALMRNAMPLMAVLVTKLAGLVAGGAGGAGRTSV